MAKLREAIIRFCEGGSEGGSASRAASGWSRRETGDDPLTVRLRELATRTDMAAPNVFGEESFPDPNIVAEYLDRTLDDPELLAEYEKACLEDDVLLAELLDSIRQATAPRPDRPTALPARCRHRLYYLGRQSDREPAAPIYPGDTAPVCGKDAPVCTQNDTKRESRAAVREPERVLADYVASARIDDIADDIAGDIVDEYVSKRSLPKREPARYASNIGVRPRTDARVSKPVGKETARDDGWTRFRRHLYRATVMFSIIGVMILFFRLPVDQRAASLSRLRGIWAVLHDDTATATNREPERTGTDRIESDTLAPRTFEAPRPANHGDFPIRTSGDSTLGHNEPAGMSYSNMPEIKTGMRSTTLPTGDGAGPNGSATRR